MRLMSVWRPQSAPRTGGHGTDPGDDSEGGGKRDRKWNDQSTARLIPAGPYVGQCVPPAPASAPAPARKQLLPSAPPTVIVEAPALR